MSKEKKDKQKKEKLIGKRLAKAAEKVCQHASFEQLRKCFASSRRSELTPELAIERAELTYRLCQEGQFSERAVAAALKVDPGTIGRDCDLAKRPDAEKQEIRKGKSITALLKAAQEATRKPDRSSKHHLAAGAAVAPITEGDRQRQCQGSANWGSHSNPAVPPTQSIDVPSWPRKQHSIETRNPAQIGMELGEDVVRWLRSAGVTAKDAINILDSAKKENRLHPSRLRDQQASTAPLEEIIDRTKPNSEATLSKCDYYVGWLLSWLTLVQPDSYILRTAIGQANNIFSNHLLSETVYGPTWTAIQQNLAQVKQRRQDAFRHGAALIKHPQSNWSRHRGPTQAEQEAQFWAEIAKGKGANAKDIRRQMGWPQPPQPITESQDIALVAKPLAADASHLESEQAAAGRRIQEE